MVKNLSIFQKFLVMILVISVVPLILLSVTSYYLSKTAVQTEAYNQNKVFFELTRSQFNAYFFERKGDAKVISQEVALILSESSQESTETSFNFADITSEKRKKLDSVLKTALKEYGYSDIFITDEKGKIVYSVAEKSIEGSDCSHREYFQRAIRGELNWSDLLYSDVYKCNVMVLSSPIYYEQSIIGTVNLVIFDETLDNIVHDGIDQLGKTADSYLVSSDGTLYSTTRLGEFTSQDVVLKKKIDTHAQKVLSEKINTGDKEFVEKGIYKDYRGERVVGTFGVVQLGDKLVGLIIEQDEAEAFDSVYLLRNLLLILSVSVIVIAILLGLYFSKMISNPLKYASEITKRIASGDLSAKIDKYLDQKDETGLLIQSINNMQNNLREIVSTLSLSSKQLDNSAQELSSTSEEMNAFAEEMAMQMEEIDKATQNASASVEEVTSGVEEVSASAQNVAKASQELSEKARKVESSAREGREAVKIISDIIVQTKEKSSKTESVVRELSEKARNIGEIVQTINSIAEQTNLLALNAAIEAARAGEAGRGFAVVADEIRKLAEESKQATSKIEHMLSEIQTGAELASNATSETAKVVEKAYEQSDTVTKQLAIILSQVEEITNQIENLAASAQEQSAAAQEMTSAMDTVTRAITTIANQVSDVTSGFKKISTATQNVSSSAEELSAISKSLVEQVEKFKI